MIKIAIDGPSGAGKSSLAKSVAKNLGIVYVDTGALYRAVGLYMYRFETDSTDASAVIAKLCDIKIELKYEDGAQHVYLCGEDVSEDIRTPIISKYASDISSIAEVREYLLDIQRDISRTNSVVMDGRDIGTVIMPDADVKIFLTASAEARALRRYHELLGKGSSVSYNEIYSAMILRDANDSGRTIAPAIPAEDAIMLDNSEYGPQDTYKIAMDIIDNKLKLMGKQV